MIRTRISAEFDRDLLVICLHLPGTRLPASTTWQIRKSIRNCCKDSSHACGSCYPSTLEKRYSDFRNFDPQSFKKSADRSLSKSFAWKYSAVHYVKVYSRPTYMTVISCISQQTYNILMLYCMLRVASKMGFSIFWQPATLFGKYSLSPSLCLLRRCAMDHSVCLQETMGTNRCFQLPASTVLHNLQQIA